MYKCIFKLVGEDEQCQGRKFPVDDILEAKVLAIEMFNRILQTTHCELGYTHSNFFAVMNGDNIVGYAGFTKLNKEGSKNALSDS